MKPETKKAGGRPRGFDRDAALARAMELFWARGYEGVSISDLAAVTGLHPPSLYSAFGDKKRLFLEAVDTYQGSEGGFMAEALAHSGSARDVIEALLRGAVESYTRPGAPAGCMVVLGATNCAVASQDVQDDLSARRVSGRGAIAARLARGAVDGDFTEGADPLAIADLVTAVLHGLSIAARDNVAADRMHAMVDAAIAALPFSRPK